MWNPAAQAHLPRPDLVPTALLSSPSNDRRDATLCLQGSASGSPWAHAGIRDIDHGCFDAGAADAVARAPAGQARVGGGDDGVLVHEALPIWLYSGPRLFGYSSTMTS